MRHDARAASEGKIKAADLLFVGGADVEVAQKCAAHFVRQFGVGAPVVTGSEEKKTKKKQKTEKNRCGPRKETGRKGGEKNQLKTYLGKI